MKDPLDAIEHPTLAERIKPYRKYGDSELALSLLHFQQREQIGIPSLNRDSKSFEVDSQPANVGYEFECPNCNENVRSVSIPNKGLTLCPLCLQNPGMLALGKGPQ